MHPRARLRLLLLAFPFLLASCSREDPLMALNAATDTLQAALEAKSPDRTLALLHEKFTAQTPEDGRDWARQTMTATFLRYKTIKIVAQNIENQINPRFPDHATTHCDVLLIGAEGVVSGNARRYRAELEWVREKQAWKLLRLKWQ
ncbi:MAG: hypothetical protein LBO79_08445 [Zoogloeaceae bacterium]|jgi:hypothetical protein|nr:hypothetical protein [Zoogloeaceae bacterium]